MQKTKKKENGITLIALVVTVIVILILASVTLNILFDEGLIDKTHEAANSVNYSQDNEMTQLNVLMGYIRNGTGYTPGSGSSGGSSGGGSSGGSSGGTFGGGAGGGSTTTGSGIYLTDGSWDVTKGVNSPNLLNGMVGIYWDENGNEITVTSSNCDNWYDYATQKWANAKTGDGSYWVWIPRFAYRIGGGGCKTGTSGTIGIKFLQGTSDSDYRGETVSKTYPTVSSGTMSDYVIHPAFTDGTDNNFKNGEWDAEITGFWVAKFAMSHADSTAVNIGTFDNFKSKPNYRIATDVSIGDAYTYGLNYDSTKNSHMTKNSERGALYYLTYSPYGYDSLQPSTNSCSSYVAGAGYSSLAYVYNLASFHQSYGYKTSSGESTSSTGNITGVYDLFTSWNKSEFTAAYIPEGNTWSVGPSTNQTTGLSAGSSFATVTSRDETAYQTASTKYCTVYPCGKLTTSKEPYTMTITTSDGTYSTLVPGDWSYDPDAWVNTATTYMFGDSVIETQGWWIGLGYHTTNAFANAASTNTFTYARNTSIGTFYLPMVSGVGTFHYTKGGVFFGGEDSGNSNITLAGIGGSVSAPSFTCSTATNTYTAVSARTVATVTATPQVQNNNSFVYNWAQFSASYPDYYYCAAAYNAQFLAASNSNTNANSNTTTNSNSNRNNIAKFSSSSFSPSTSKRISSGSFTVLMNVNAYTTATSYCNTDTYVYASTTQTANFISNYGNWTSSSYTNYNYAMYDAEALLRNEINFNIWINSLSLNLAPLSVTNSNTNTKSNSNSNSNSNSATYIYSTGSYNYTIPFCTTGGTMTRTESSVTGTTSTYNLSSNSVLRFVLI